MKSYLAELLFAMVMLATAGAVALRGAVLAAVALGNVLFAALLAMNWFEPLSDVLAESAGRGGLFSHYCDFAALLALFLLAFFILRFATSRLLPENPDLPLPMELPARWSFGVLTGFLTAAFVLAAVHTFPASRDFGGLFPPRPEDRSGVLMRFAPDYLWLGFTQHVSEVVFPYGGGKRVFDGPELSIGEHHGRWPSFPLRYARWREQLHNKGASEKSPSP